MDYIIKKVGSNRGTPRIFLDGQQAIRAGFSPGDRYEVTVSENYGIVLEVKKDGSRVVSSRKARKEGEKPLPVIDIESDKLLSIFEGMEAVRMIVRDGKVYFLPMASELHKRDRLKRLADKMHNNEPLKMGSLTHGGGVLANAIHKGLEEAGVKADLVFANDIRDDLLMQASEHNDAWGPATSALSVGLQEAVQDEWLMQRLPKLDALDMSLPCSGASRAGASKLGLDKPEDHPEVGHLVFGALVIVTRTQPAVLLLENVEAYASSASAQILRYQLRDMGYNIHEAIISGKDWGCLENRVRWCLVATTQGLHFDFDRIEPHVTIVRKLGDVLEPLAEDDPRWRPMTGLKAKQERDIEKGNGFRMQIIDADSVKVPTLTKGYAKIRSTDPKVAHPSDPDLLRQLTAKEHARIKGVPESLITGLSETTAHELLGQAIVYDPFKDVGKRIGDCIQQFWSEAATKQAQKGALAEATAAAPRRRFRGVG